MVDVEEALRYPARGDAWPENVLLGGAFHLLGGIVPVVPQLFVYGYGARVLRDEGDGDAPVFEEEWEELLVDGVLLFAVGLVFGLAAAAPWLLVGAGFVVGVAADSTAVLVVAGLFAVVALAFSLAVGYVVPASFALYAREGDAEFVAAFDRERLRTVLGSREYLVAWLYALAIAVVVSVAGTVAFAVLAVVLVVSVVGIFLLPLLAVAVVFPAFYLMVVGFRLFEQAVTGVLGPPPAEAET